ncbi:helix-turn-helix domain-containing protein [Rhodococcoides kroppenstedtii]|nr:helix-turn-helix domain-containing protein [Rhodococcus kroppenstedtii]
MPRGAQRVLDLLRAADTPLGTGDIAEHLEWTRPTVLTRLRALQAEGLIEWSGTSTRDPRAVWSFKALP